jgi:hypothetical protein
MAIPSVEVGFETWRNEAAQYIGQRQEIDAQIPIIALAGVYSVLAPLESRTSHDWRVTVTQNTDTSMVLRSILPEMQRDYFDPTYYEAVDGYRDVARERDSSQLRFERISIFDGLQPEIHQIRADEHYLARVLGHAAHNMNVLFQPLKLSLRVSAPVMLDWWPKTFHIVEDNWR